MMQTLSLWMRSVFKTRALKSLWPSTCLFCRLPSNRPIDLCAACETALPWLTHSCQRCAAPLAKEDSALYCGTCIQTVPYFDSAHALFFYISPIDHFIKRLKFKHCLAAAHVFGQLMAEKMAEFYKSQASVPELLIPVPLHVKRLKTRGFNQAIELARPIRRKLKVSIDYSTCQRLRDTKAQMDLSFNERRANIKNAFALRKSLEEKSVCIIDDVMTTSNTVSELSRVLKLNGVSRVDVWCCARASRV